MGEEGAAADVEPVVGPEERPLTPNPHMNIGAHVGLSFHGPEFSPCEAPSAD